MPMFGFFQPPSEEEQQEMKEAFERHRMSIEEFNHSFQRMFEELGEDHLKTIRTAFHIITDNDHSIVAGQWDAMASWELKKRFGICVTCGVNHETELIPNPPVNNNIGPDGKPLTEQELSALQTFEKVVLKDPDALDLFADLTPEERAMANMYHIDDLRNAETGELLGFYCTGIDGMTEPCGMRYPSLQDRMLHGPESCSGCFQRMGHG